VAWESFTGKSFGSVTTKLGSWNDYFPTVQYIRLCFLILFSMNVFILKFPLFFNAKWDTHTSVT